MQRNSFLSVVSWGMKVGGAILVDSSGPQASWSRQRLPPALLATGVPFRYDMFRDAKPGRQATQGHKQNMKHHMTPLDCVAFIMIKGDLVLAEKRKLTKPIDPGAIALPGGHVEDGESPEEALYRESHEELGIVPCDIIYICTLLHRSQELQRIHYFAVEAWEGNIENNEAESLRWVPITEAKEFDIDVDRIALSEYLRIYAR